MFKHNRNQIRQQFIDVWHKHTKGLPLEPLEKLIADIISQHPEYHNQLQGDTVLDRDYLPEVGETNPFLHMGMHIALQEQFASQRPQGIVEVYQNLTIRHSDPHKAEHLMMECLGEALWQAQRDGVEPDEITYLNNLKKLV